jgi:hypothetical protein
VIVAGGADVGALSVADALPPAAPGGAAEEVQPIRARVAVANEVRKRRCRMTPRDNGFLVVLL